MCPKRSAGQPKTEAKAIKTEAKTITTIRKGGKKFVSTLQKMATAPCDFCKDPAHTTATCPAMARCLQNAQEDTAEEHYQDYQRLKQLGARRVEFEIPNADSLAEDTGDEY